MFTPRSGRIPVEGKGIIPGIRRIIPPRAPRGRGFAAIGSVARTRPRPRPDQTRAAHAPVWCPVPRGCPLLVDAVALLGLVGAKEKTGGLGDDWSRLQVLPGMGGG